MKKKYLINSKVLSSICAFVICMQTWSQPFVDPFQVRYTYGFRSNRAVATPFSHLWIGSDAPIKLKEKTYLLLSPYYERWQIDSSDTKEIVPAVQSIAFPVGLILPFNKKWSLNLMPIIRTNGEQLLKDKTMQYGGITFATWTRKSQQKFRFGVYINKEFFGVFVWPLLGADWRIGKRDYVFGLLPGRLTYEHELSKHLYWGASFRALTNSFRLNDGKYLRIDDNQLSLYMDYYSVKNFCISLEPGYGIARKIRTGINNKHYITSQNMGDGPFVRASVSYRIRL